jgi:hypothetical protein
LLYNSEEETWQKSYVLDLDHDNMAMIRLDYKRTSNDLSALGKGFEIYPNPGDKIQLFDSQGKNITDKASQEVLDDYTYFFTKKRIAKRIYGIFQPDSYSLFFSLDIHLINGEKIKLDGWRKYLPDSKELDPYQFYCWTEDEGYFILNFSDFDPILVSLDYFLKK